MRCDCPPMNCNGESGIYECCKRIDEAESWLKMMSKDAEAGREADYIRRRIEWLERKLQEKK